MRREGKKTAIVHHSMIYNEKSDAVVTLMSGSQYHLCDALCSLAYGGLLCLWRNE